MAGAAGVHLGQDDLTPADARLALGGVGIIGLGVVQALRAVAPQVGRVVAAFFDGEP